MISLNEVVAECFPGPLDFNTDLFEQGITSLALLSLVDRVADEWSTNVDLESFLCEPTIRNLDEIIAVSVGKEYTSISTVADIKNGAKETLDSTPEDLNAQWERWVASDEFLKEVDPEKDFFEYQIMSLRLLGIVDDFVSTFGVEVEIEHFLKEPTLSYLHGLLQYANEAGVDSEELAAEPELPNSDAANGGLSILSPKHEKDEFLSKFVQIRQLPSDSERITVGQLAPKYFNVLYEKRSNAAGFSAEPTSKDQVLNWLHLLSVEMSSSKPRYLYPSAGGTYPVQVYLEVKKDCVTGINAGAYYFNPLEGCLVKISESTLETDDHFYYNRDHYKSAHFCLYLVSEMHAIEPIYRNMSSSFAAIEAGCISQLLATWQAEHSLTSRLLAGVNNNKLVDLLQLGSSQKPLISMACGQVQQSVH